MNYLIDEADNMGKGSNAIMSMLHHFFAHHGLGKKTVHLHADNCGGQNKNAIMVQYLMEGDDWAIAPLQKERKGSGQTCIGPVSPRNA